MSADKLKEIVLHRSRDVAEDEEKPLIFVNDAGDFVEFFSASESYWSEYVSPELTVYRSRKTGQLIGGQICGIAKTLARAPGLRVEVHGGRVDLSILFTATVLTSKVDPDGTKHLVYDDVRKLLTEMDADVALAELAV